MLMDKQSEPDAGWYYRNPREEMFAYLPDTIRTALDIGCGCGLFGNLVRQRFGAEVWGIEIDRESGREASSRLNHVLVGDVFQMLNELPKEHFDCIILNDVLEHLVDPYSLLNKIKCLIANQGCLVCSLPNVRYYPVLKSLLFEKDFLYTDFGVLDRTHLRFFTKKSLLRMFEEQGYNVELIEGINGTKSWKMEWLNRLLLGGIEDTMHQQWACVVRPLEASQ